MGVSDNRLKKHNQAKAFFSYKNDDVTLVEISQFIRDTTKYRVEREWYLVFNKWSGSYIGYGEHIPEGFINKVRNPDIILIDKKTGKLMLVIEIDGLIHVKKFLDTEERNQDYFLAGVPFTAISDLEVTTSIFDIVNKRIDERLG